MKKFLFLIMLLILNINVYAVGEATISNIKVNGNPCNCTDYTCNIEVNSDKATITYELMDKDATVDRNSGFSIDLISQTTNIKIVVTNTSGEEKIENSYDINISKHEKSSDYSLKSLTINDDVITLMKDVIVYNYDAKYSDEELVVDAVANDINAKVIKETKYDFPLDRSSMSIDFSVKAENGDEKTYRIVVVRGVKPNTNLKSLKIDKGEIDFKKNVLEYKLTVEYNVNDLIIEAIPDDDKASVKIEKNDLVVGENTIKIIVTNDKATSEYVLLVTREANTDKSLANLKKLSIKEYPNLDFEENVLDYTLKFDEIPNSLTIKGESNLEGGIITITGNEDLKSQSKIIVKNTIKDINISREYTLNIIQNEKNTTNKTFILITIVVLIIVIIVMVILEIKDKKRRRFKEINKIKELMKIKNHEKKAIKKEEDLEII